MERKEMLRAALTGRPRCGRGDRSAGGPGNSPVTKPASPATTGVDPARLAMIDEAVTAAIADKKLPGAVVLVGRGDAVVYRKAYGNRAMTPAVEPMTLDTIFDVVPYESGGDDQRGDDAGGRRQDPVERSRGAIHPVFRQVWQGPRHHPALDDAHVRPAS